jgi:hypothetical protein
MRTSCIISTILLAGAVSAAHGDIVMQWVVVDNTPANAEVPGFSDTYATVDLQVMVTGDDDWTSIDATATAVNGAMFYQHPMEAADGLPPNPAFFIDFPALEFDSYWTAAADIGPGESGIAPGFAGDITITDTVMDATWFDTVNTGDGVFTLARYTFTPGDAVPWLLIEGSATARNTGGMLIPFSFAIPFPAPSAVAVFGVAGLVASRRRG